jgi:colanic acid biosynthesis protein WcaH
MHTELSSLLDQARAAIPDPRAGLPQEAFYFVSSLTPMINVDLLVRDPAGRTLLTWRSDRFYGPGWHIPGGIIRFKENIADRIQKVAESELGCRVRFADEPIKVQEIMNQERDVRGHFISMLFLCRLDGEPESSRKVISDMPLNGQWAWHDSAPSNLIRQHESFRRFINATPPL